MSLLNDKLNTWAGTKGIDYTDTEFGIAYCFKWLVPKLGTWVIRNYVPQIVTYLKPRAEVSWQGGDPEVKGGWLWGNGEAETATLALCLAIEKLTDKEE